MKKIILYVMSFFMIAGSYCQQSDPSQTITREDYLKKSKHQKTAAWILLGAGTFSAGLLAGIETNPNSIVGGDDSRKSGFLVAGLAAIGASIPLFIASGRNKKKGLAVTTLIKNERLQMLEPSLLNSQHYLAFFVKLDLK